MAFSMKNVRTNGCLFGPPSERDYRTVFRDRAVPDRVDLRPYCTEVEDQGQIGSCTSNATVGAIEYHLKRRNGSSPDLSRMFVYFNARRMRGQIMQDTGAHIREAMASVMAFGACREEIWPYNPQLFAAEPSYEAYNDAHRYEAVQYARVDGGQGAISALAQELPVVFGTVIPSRCFEEAGRTGLIPEPTPEELAAPASGGHAMLIVGYDNPSRMFIVRNSWGAEWGDRGYCQIPYDVMDACSRAEDFWVVAELEKKTGFELIRPARTAAPSPRAAAQPSGLAGAAAKMRDQIRAGLESDLSASARKIDSLVAGRKAGATRPNLMPCTACAGSGICPFCSGKKRDCLKCSGTGSCATCGGSGVL